jgi:hypothetical protein
LTGSQKKTAYCIRKNVEDMIVGHAKRHLEWVDCPGKKRIRAWVADCPENLNCTGFLTLTVGDWIEGEAEPDFDGKVHRRGKFVQVWDAKEANRRVNNLNRRFLPSLFEKYVIVTERHKSGAVHYHAVGILRGKWRAVKQHDDRTVVEIARPDIRTGFDFDAVKSGDYSSVCPELKAIWKKMRPVSQGGDGVLERYGFGRSELTPIRKTAAQIASYIQKYIQKNLFNRVEADKGKRLVRYGGWKGQHLKPNDFSWAGEQARQWRFRSRICGAILGVTEREGMTEVLGPRWAFQIHKAIQWQETWPVPFWEMTDSEFKLFADDIQKRALNHYWKERDAEVAGARLGNALECRRWRNRTAAQIERDEIFADHQRFFGA